MRQITFLTVFFLHVTIPVIEGQINSTLNAILRQALDDAINTVQPQTFASLRIRPGQAGQAGQRGPTGAAAAAPPPTAPVGNSPQDLLDLFGGQTEDPQASSANSISGQLFRTFRQNSVAQSGQSFRSRAVQAELPSLADVIKRNCMLPLRPVCVDGYPYRYPDGSCNNPNSNILRGAAQTAQPRFVEAEYEEDDAGISVCPPNRSEILRLFQLRVRCSSTAPVGPLQLDRLTSCKNMSFMDGEEEWSDWSDTDLLKIHNYYELNGGQSTGETQHTTSASQNQHTKSPVNGDNESNHCISEESESRPSNISSEQSSDTIRDRPSQHDDIPRNDRNETNASCSNASEIELSSTLTEQSSAASNTTSDISGGN
ncbi:Hypothetical predicted protein [Mytilus galloprovincialis]|uniref:Uncharacterized protein n=1 Tax=Mytilus galloprovincialis TaxID=29158 RepID=A0A8B6F206_MYTGA